MFYIFDRIIEIKMESEKYFVQSPDIKAGQVFIDSFTGLTFGIRHITYDRLSFGSVTFPKAEPHEINNVSPGYKWQFTFESKNFEITLLELNYLNDTFKIQIAEK